MKWLLTIVLIFWSSSLLQAQELIFKNFQDYCLCGSELFERNQNDSILYLGITASSDLRIDLVGESTCFTKHLGGVRMHGDTLDLRVHHESFQLPTHYKTLGYVKSDLIEVADCSSKFIFGFIIGGLNNLPQVITLNGKVVSYNR